MNQTNVSTECGKISYILQPQQNTHVRTRPVVRSQKGTPIVACGVSVVGFRSSACTTEAPFVEISPFVGSGTRHQ